MQVSLREFKRVLSNAKTVLNAGGLDGGLFAQLRANDSGLWIGCRSDAVSYEAVMPFIGEADFIKTYVPLNSINSMLFKVTKNDELTLSMVGNDLVLSSSLEDGVVKTVEGVAYAKPEFAIAKAEPYCILRNGDVLVRAIKHVSNVKKGWKASTKPYAANFLRLMVEESDSPLCKVLIGATYSDQEELTQYASGTALSVFSSDGNRYFQTFEPIFRVHQHEIVSLNNSALLNNDWVGKSLHLTVKDAEILAKLLSNEQYRVAVISDHGTPEALVLFNKNTRIWVRLYRGRYPDTDFNKQLAFFMGDEVAKFTPDKAFIAAVKAAAKLKATTEHGLTVLVGDGRIAVSSPEHANAVRYGEVEAETYTNSSTSIVDGNGFIAAIDAEVELTIIAGEEFLIVNNLSDRSRTVLRQFTR